MNGQISPELWMHDVFRSRAACEGRVVRRKLRDVERYVGLDRFVAELERRGYHAIENAGQIIIFCNQEPLRRIT